MKFIFVLLFITTTSALDNQDAPLVEISNGLLQGAFEKSYDGRTFSSFEGIPYARPPVGELRFEAPKEPYNWTGTWIANTKHTCLQNQGPMISVFTSNRSTASQRRFGDYDDDEHYVQKLTACAGDEDCLYLNVYVPREKLNPSDNLKVIVHIHGGGFTMWSGHFYSGPKYLMDEEVIFVTMNYRLGPFGFLSTQDEVVPGNNGMKDQVLSLQWIQKNIKYFGGNPDSVTITGMSAGGVSVHLHYFSILSKGLFHTGVSQSGTVSDLWAILQAPLKSATNLAEASGCPTGSSRELVDCLKFRSGKKIIEDLVSLESGVVWPMSFGPVIEHEHAGAFLTQHPYNMLLDKTVTDVPWIVSVTEREGIFAATALQEAMSELTKDFDNFIPHMLFYSDIDDETKQYVTNQIKEHYLIKDSSDIVETFIDIFSDRMVLSLSDIAAKLQAKANKSPVYFYNFGYRGQHSLLDLLMPNSKQTAATHGDDCQYYLHSDAAEEKLSESDERMKQIFMEWLLSFAETQEPKVRGVQWNRVSGDKALEIMHFKDPDNIFMKSIEDFGSSNFWSRLPLKENQYHKRIRDEL